VQELYSNYPYSINKSLKKQKPSTHKIRRKIKNGRIKNNLNIPVKIPAIFSIFEFSNSEFGNKP
jgi:hypothetical protein